MVRGRRLTGLGVTTLAPIICCPHTARRMLVKPTSKHSIPGLDCSRSPLTQLHPNHTCPHHVPQTPQPHSYLRTLAFVSAPGTLFSRISTRHFPSPLGGLCPSVLSQALPPSYLTMQAPHTSTSHSLPLGLITSCACLLFWCLIHVRVFISGSSAHRTGPDVKFFSHSVVSDSLRPHGQQHSRPPCPSPTTGVCPSSWSLIW